MLFVIETFGIAYGHKIFAEEKGLIKESGNNYVKYMKRTKNE